MKTQTLSTKISRQISIALLVLSLSIFVCEAYKQHISHFIIAIVFLFEICLFALYFQIITVLLASIISALCLNYFFIPPYYSLHIQSSEDVLYYLIFFIFAIVNSVLSHKISQAKQAESEKMNHQKNLELYNTVFNSLSHELRTPLSTIIAASDALIHQQKLLSSVQQSTLLNEIAIAGKRLETQIENMLNMSRLESGLYQIKSDWHDCNSLILETIHSVENTENHLIQFTENDNLPLVKIDETLFQHILYNLLANAIKYTPPNTEIKIEVHLVDDARLHVKVSDNGNGVLPEDLEQLFDKFFRGANVKAGGTGLGLSIVKGYTEAMQGNIKALHNTPKGLIFLLDLPIETSYINHLKNE